MSLSLQASIDMAGHLKQLFCSIATNLLLGNILLKPSVQHLEGLWRAYLLCIPVTRFLRYTEPGAQ